MAEQTPEEAEPSIRWPRRRGRRDRRPRPHPRQRHVLGRPVRGQPAGLRQRDAPGRLRDRARPRHGRRHGLRRSRRRARRRSRRLPRLRPRPRLPRRRPGRSPPLRARRAPTPCRSWPTGRTIRRPWRRSAMLSLELGDVAAAADAYANARRRRRFGGRRASASATSRSSRAGSTSRRGVRGRPSRPPPRRARAAARSPGIQYQLGDTLIATGDRPGAATAYAAALAADPSLAPRPLGSCPGRRRRRSAGRRDRRLLARPSTSCRSLNSLARRADLYRLRGAAGDATLEAADRKTVLAIAQLAGTAVGRLRPDPGALPRRLRRRPRPRPGSRRGRARRPQGCLRLRCAGLGAARQRPPGGGRRRDDRGRSASGTRDAKLLYHAGMIKAALGEQRPTRASS